MHLVHHLLLALNLVNYSPSPFSSLIPTLTLPPLPHLITSHLGVLLLQLTGHRDLVTSLDFISIPSNVPTSLTSTASATAVAAATVDHGAGTSNTDTDASIVDNESAQESGEKLELEMTTKSIVNVAGMTDMIVSVSDDQTARVFYLDASSLLT